MNAACFACYHRTNSVLLGSFAAVALALAAIGTKLTKLSLPEVVQFIFYLVDLPPVFKFYYSPRHW